MKEAVWTFLLTNRTFLYTASWVLKYFFKRNLGKSHNIESYCWALQHKEAHWWYPIKPMRLYRPRKYGFLFCVLLHGESFKRSTKILFCVFKFTSCQKCIVNGWNKLQNAFFNWKETQFEMQVPGEWRVAWVPVNIVEYHNTPLSIVIYQ